MGLRDRVRKKLRQTLDRLSGEHSAAAPDAIQPFERNLPPNQDIEIVKAKLERPREQRGED